MTTSHSSANGNPPSLAEHIADVFERAERPASQEREHMERGTVTSPLPHIVNPTCEACDHHRRFEGRTQFVGDPCDICAGTRFDYLGRPCRHCSAVADV